DYKKLIDKPMSSITRFDLKKSDEQLKSLENDIKEVNKHLKHLTDYAIAWFEKLKQKYGPGRERKTEIRQFDRVEASKVALANVKLYMNREDGFVGTGLRKDEFVCDCSDLDEIIVFREDGKFNVSKVAEKTFVGKGILHAQVFKKNDERTVYNMIYRDGESGTSYIKRFSVLGVTREKEYDLTKGAKGSKTLYFTPNPNGEAEIVSVQLKPHSKLKKLQFDIDFAEHVIKGRSSMGNIVTKYPVKKVVLKSKGVSTLSGRKIWYDEILKRLNVDSRGKYLGEFDGDDRILTVEKHGIYELSSFDLSNHFDDHLLLIEKYNPEKVFTAVYIEGKSSSHYLKRFVLENSSIGRKMSIIGEEGGSRLILFTGLQKPKVNVEILKGKTKISESLEMDLAETIEVKGMKALGNRLSPHDVKSVDLIAPSELELDDVVISDPIPVNAGEVYVEVPGVHTATPISSMAIDLDVDPEIPEAKEIEEIQPEEPLAEAEESPAQGEIEPEQPVHPAEKVSEPKQAVTKQAEEPRAAKKVDFEITNPEDLDIDDKGQLGLF
ncbi:MAG: DNA gyrase/topoisomerase IV subunit A, partial [Daejeonella sp.]